MTMSRPFIPVASTGPVSVGIGPVWIVGVPVLAIGAGIYKLVEALNLMGVVKQFLFGMLHAYLSLSDTTLMAMAASLTVLLVVLVTRRRRREREAREFELANARRSSTEDAVKWNW